MAKKNLSKLTKKVITDKHGHRRTVWVKMGEAKNQPKKNTNDVLIGNLKKEVAKYSENHTPSETKEWLTKVLAADKKYNSGSSHFKTGDYEKRVKKMISEIKESTKKKEAGGGKITFTDDVNKTKKYSSGEEAWKDLPNVTNKTESNPDPYHVTGDGKGNFYIASKNNGKYIKKESGGDEARPPQETDEATEDVINKKDLAYQLKIDYSGNTPPKISKLNKTKLSVYYGYKIDHKEVVESFEKLYPNKTLIHERWGAGQRGGTHHFKIEDT